MKTLLYEYESEAKASGHEPHYREIPGEAKDPRTVKRAYNIIAGWGIPMSTVEVREIDDEGDSEGLGNFDDLLLEVEEKALAKWESALGVKFSPL